jgi:hypothetical protein
VGTGARAAKSVGSKPKAGGGTTTRQFDGGAAGVATQQLAAAATRDELYELARQQTFQADPA